MNGMDGLTDAGAEPVDQRDALRQSIEDDKAELLDAVDELKTAVQQQFQLRDRIAEHPGPWLVGGALFGLWLGTRS